MLEEALNCKFLDVSPFYLRSMCALDHRDRELLTLKLALLLKKRGCNIIRDENSLMYIQNRFLIKETVDLFVEKRVNAANIKISQILFYNCWLQ